MAGLQLLLQVSQQRIGSISQQACWLQLTAKLLLWREAPPILFFGGNKSSNSN
jgi:hypothetical protein